MKQVDKLEESFVVINSGPKPLAAYIFTNNKKLKELFVRNISAGGLVVNDTTLHVIVLLFLHSTLDTSDSYVQSEQQYKLSLKSSSRLNKDWRQCGKLYYCRRLKENNFKILS